MSSQQKWQILIRLRGSFFTQFKFTLTYRFSSKSTKADAWLLGCHQDKQSSEPVFPQSWYGVPISNRRLVEVMPQ